MKKGVLSGLFLRALRICSKSHLQSELDTLWAVFKQLGYPDFFIKQAVLSARCTFHASKASAPAPPTAPDHSSLQDPNSTIPSLTTNPTISDTTDPQTTTTPSSRQPDSASTDTPIHATPGPTPSKPKTTPIILPWHPTFTCLNSFLRASNYRIVFTYKDSIRRRVVNNRGASDDNKPQRHVVYQIPCTISSNVSLDCEQPYYGRTSQQLQRRLAQHARNIENNHQNSALVEHLQAHPNHKFNLDSATTIWESDSIMETQIVESACISELPSCNVHPGEIAMSPILAALTVRMADLSKHARPKQLHPDLQPANNTQPPSTPTQTSQPANNHHTLPTPSQIPHPNPPIPPDPPAPTMASISPSSPPVLQNFQLPTPTWIPHSSQNIHQYIPPDPQSVSLHPSAPTMSPISTSSQPVLRNFPHTMPSPHSNSQPLPSRYTRALRISTQGMNSPMRLRRHPAKMKK